MPCRISGGFRPIQILLFKSHSFVCLLNTCLLFHLSRHCGPASEPEPPWAHFWPPSAPRALGWEPHHTSRRCWCALWIWLHVAWVKQPKVQEADVLFMCYCKANAHFLHVDSSTGLSTSLKWCVGMQIPLGSIHTGSEYSEMWGLNENLQRN